MKLFNKLLLPITLSSLIVIGIVSYSVNAQSPSANSAQGLEISPALVELNAAKGKSYDVKLSITNVTASDLVYDSSVADFGAANETGSPTIILDGNLPETSSIKSWVSMIPEFTLKTRETKVIMAKISVPLNAEPGGHYGVLRFSGRAPEVENTGVGLSASAGVLILVRVDGEINEKANLKEFFTANNGKQTFFFENSPINFVTRIKNEGNIHLKPSGSIEVRDMLGGLVETIAVNNDRSNVLPDSIRRFETTLNKNWMIGRYTASLTLGYGTTGQALTSMITFWVIPYKIILAGILIIATIIFIVKRMFKSLVARAIEKEKHGNSNTTKKTTKK